MSAPAPARPDLAGDLWLVAQRTAGGRGCQFSSECAQEMQGFIQTGVGTLMQDRALESAEKIAEAKDAMVRLVEKMIELAIEQQRGQAVKATESTSVRTLHEYNFLSARSWFCPCYPFC